jgi:hypothetical protein
MGLITGILTFPLAPVRGVVALAELLHDEAQAQLTDPDRIREELARVEDLRSQGVLDEESAMAWEDLLIERLMGEGPAAGGGI